MSLNDAAFELFFERSPAAAFVFDVVTLRFLAVNAAARALYGYTRAEMLRMKATQIRPRSDVRRFVTAVRELPKVGTSLQIPGTWTHLPKSGIPMEISVSATRLTFQGHEACISIVREVSEIVKLRREVSDFREMWRGVLESAPDYIWTVDRAGIVKTTNRPPPWVASDAIIGRSVYSSMRRRRDRGAFREALRAAFVRGEKAVVRAEFEHAGGSLWFDHRVAPLRENGRVVAAVIVSSDVTQRRRIERAFEESRLLLNSLFANAPYFIMSIDRRGLIGFINRQSEPIHVVGRTIYELALPESRAAMRRAVTSVFRHEKKASYEAKSAGRDGKPLVWRASLGPIVENGRVASAIVIAHDATEEKRSAEELARTQGRFRGIFENSRDAMDFVTLDGKLVEVNPAFERMVGYSRKELLESFTFKDLTPPEYQEISADAVRQLLAKGEPVEFEKEYIRKDGSRVPLALTTFLIKDPQGRPEGFAAIIRDISERRRLEREILQTGAREQSQLGRELHDSLGQELTGISLLAQSLARGLEGADAKHAESARAIAEAARIAVEEVRALAAGLMPAELLPGGLPVALEALRARAERIFGLRVELRCPSRPDGLKRLEDVSLIHLYRIAQEAVTNAAKHAKAGKVVISLSQRRGRLELSIRDNGIGLRAERGEGLGLKIMRRRCLSLGGTFAARPRRPAGTEIVCSIPFVL